MARAKQTQRERDLAAEIRAMLGLAKDAQGRGSFSAAVHARAKVSALRTELSRMVAERQAEETDDPLVRIQRLRRLATESGSYTAAGTLTKLEVEIEEARRLASEATRDGLEGATQEEILSVVQAAIMALPDTLVLQVQATVEARLTGARLRVV